MTYRFIVVPGIWTRKSWAKKRKLAWKKSLEKYFPNSEYKGIEEFYGPFDIQHISDIISKIAKEIEGSKKPVVLVGTSYGGLMTHVATGSLDKKVEDKIALFLTHATPYFLRFFFREPYRSWFYKSLKTEATHITIGSYFDILSPYFLSHHIDSIKRNIPNTHLALTKKEIVGITLKLLQEYL